MTTPEYDMSMQIYRNANRRPVSEIEGQNHLFEPEERDEYGEEDEYEEGVRTCDNYRNGFYAFLLV